MHLGFIGLGQMGSGMAANLQRAGHRVKVYNRSPDKAAPLVALGATLASSVKEAAADAEIIFTMVADDAALEAVMFGDDGALAHLPKGALHIGCSTISTALAERLTAAHAGAGQDYLAAPVFGRPEAAAAAKLFIIAAGSPAALDRAEPLLAVIGQKTFRFGSKPSAANLVKLSGNFLIASVIEAMGEAMALVGKGGIDQRAYLDMLTSTLFTAPVYKTYGGLIAERRYEPAGFAAPLGLKDMRLALAAAESLQVPMPLGSLLRDRFIGLLAQGGSHLDWSAIAQLSSRDSGQE